MDIALINNRNKIVAVGRYSFTLAEILSNYEKVDHYFLNHDTSSLELKGFDETNLIYRAGFLLRNAYLKKSSLFKLLMDYELASHIPSDYSVYHITSNVLSNLLGLNNLNGKLVLTIHDIFLKTFPENIIERSFSTQLVYKRMSKADAIIVDSYYTKEDLLSYFPNLNHKPIEVIYPGVSENFFPMGRFGSDKIRFKYSIPAKCKVLLHIGTKVLRKNNSCLIYLMNYLIYNCNIKDIILIKVGSWDAKSLKLIKRFKLNKFIINLHNLTEDDIIELYNMSNIFIFPSYAEGFGFPALEAMACGTPIVASNQTSLPEVIGDAGVLIDPDDFQSFSEHIIEILRDENLAKYYRNKGLERAKQFNWEQTAKKTLSIYESVQRK